METLLQPNQAGSVGTPAIISVPLKGINRGRESRVNLSFNFPLFNNIDNKHADHWTSREDEFI